MIDKTEGKVNELEMSNRSILQHDSFDSTQLKRFMESVKNLINQNEEKIQEQMKSMNSKLSSEIQSSLNCVDLLKKYESSIQADLN